MPAETIIPPRESHTKCGCKTSSHYSCITSVRLFVLTTCHPPSPRRPTSSGRGGRRPPGKMRTSSRPPGSWRPPPAGGMRSSCLMHWWLTSRPGRFRPGDVHFSQVHCHPSILHPIADVPMARMGRKDVNPTKTNKTNTVASKSLSCCASDDYPH